MVTTRSQSNQNRQTENGTMNRSSDSESETSFPDVLSRDQIADLDSEDVLTRRQNNNNYDIDHRFNEINRQIGDLTDIVLSLTNQLASVNGEGNRLNAVTTNTNSRSDTFNKVFPKNRDQLEFLDLNPLYQRSFLPTTTNLLLYYSYFISLFRSFLP